jgi:hypothetical protein
MSNLLAYHGDKKIKAEYLSRVRRHAKADEIVQGQYWQGGKGCAIGCTIHGSDYGVYEKELGIPRKVAILEDVIFEGLSNVDAKAWPERFLVAIQPGQDLSLVWPKFAIRMLTDEKHGMATIAKDSPKALKIIRSAATLFERYVAGNPPSTAEWSAAWMAARVTRAAVGAMDATASIAVTATMEAMAAMSWDTRATIDEMVAMAVINAMAVMDARAAMDVSWSRFADWLIELIKAA